MFFFLALFWTSGLSLWASDLLCLLAHCLVTESVSVKHCIYQHLQKVCFQKISISNPRKYDYQNWNFQRDGRGGGGGCSNPKTLHQGEVQIFSGTTQASKVFHLRDKGRGMVLG